MRIRPRQGVKVRHPQTRQHIPESGIEVSETDTYWARRLRDGDVEIVAEVAEVAEIPAALAAPAKAEE